MFASNDTFEHLYKLLLIKKIHSVYIVSTWYQEQYYIGINLKNVSFFNFNIFIFSFFWSRWSGAKKHPHSPFSNYVVFGLYLHVSNRYITKNGIFCFIFKNSSKRPYTFMLCIHVQNTFKHRCMNRTLYVVVIDSLFF